MADEKRTQTCLECMNEIDLDPKRDYKVGDIIECPYCGSELEVSKVTAERMDVILVVAEK